MLQFTRAIRMFMHPDFHASMESGHKNIRVNCKIKRLTRELALCYDTKREVHVRVQRDYIFCCF